MKGKYCRVITYNPTKLVITYNPAKPPTKLLAVAKKPHTIGEQLILLCCQVILSNVFGKSEV